MMGRGRVMSAPRETPAAAATQRVTLALAGLSQGAGPVALERALGQHAGVHYAYVCPTTEMVYIVYDPTQISASELVAAVEGAEFHAETPEPR
jgi:hypothetical protein